MKIIAITGSIGCGKTFLANIIRSLGYVVYDADKWCKYLYYRPAFLKVVKQNFPEVFEVDGSFNKRKLRNLVFNDNSELKRLEKLIHPFLKQKLLNVIHKNAETERVFFFDAALLFEMKWDIYCQAVILADVDKNIQKQRVMVRDHIVADDFEKIVSLQMDNEQKKMFTDVVVNTDKPENLLKAELIKIIEELTDA
ncbi:MAG: dephospho-CoA kinase [Alphaproteobacteria bacterium]|nr:dephospho-CoA kinase [Alphaproteobacteria bacterium]MDY4688955.1 dephospho-CoA kinase [Alphaproteobacteria bacterium]